MSWRKRCGIDRRDLEKYGSLDRSERTGAITGGRW